MDEGIVRQVVEKATENGYWKTVYEGSPTEKSKRYWELAFCRTAGIEKEISQEMYDEVLVESKKIKKELSIEDLEYLRKVIGPGRFSADCKKRIEELKANEGQ